MSRSASLEPISLRSACAAVGTFFTAISIKQNKNLFAMAMTTVIVLVCLLYVGIIFANPSSLYQRELFREVSELLNLESHNDVGQRSSASSSSGNDYDDMSKPDRPVEVKNWPKEALNVGQISGVAVNSDLQPVIFHRQDRIWDASTFNSTHHYQHTDLGPIKEHTVLTLDPATGKVLHRWGDDLFYMPHGLTLDRHDNIWVTDVALHQVFKFRPGELSPALTFGQAFEPGPGIKHLCKPTHVAVASTGEIFIADGYCNSRILKYNAAGGLLRVIPNPPEFLSLQVPHALALIEPLDRLCVADRENMRVTCPRAGLYSVQGKSEPALTIQQPDMGRVFGVASRGNLIYAVNGPTNRLLPVQGLTIDPQTETVIDHWAPENGFGNPHAIAACPNNSAIYVVEIGPNRVFKFELQHQTK